MSYPVSYYLNLLTGQYAQSVKLQAFLSVFLEKMNDISECSDSMANTFDLDLAVDKQLDIIGEIIGVSRVLNFQPSNSMSPILNDDDYRILLKATIGTNHWDGKFTSLNGLWQNLFPSGYIIIQDNQDMTINIFLVGNFNLIMIDMITHGLIIPRPQGVLINYMLGQVPFFGFDSENDYISGFDVGHWL